jgi:hypothetical protein
MFYRITVPVLYYEVILEINELGDEQFKAFLSSDSIKHIRELKICPKQENVDRANTITSQILARLPKDILKAFSWDPPLPISHSNLICLYRRQRRMKHLFGATTPDKSILDDIPDASNASNAFSNIRTLLLFPGNQEGLDHCALLLKNSPNLDTLILQPLFGYYEYPNSESELNDSASGLGRITSTVFAHMQPFADCKPLALRHFSLCEIDLRYPVNTYCRLIEFRTVEILRLYRCGNAGALFVELSKSTKLPNILKTLEVSDAEQGTSDPLVQFLSLVTGVERLLIDMRGVTSLPAPAIIIRHSKTLKLLGIHGTRREHDDDELVYDCKSFTEICAKCKLIEQISVAFPPLSLIGKQPDTFINDLPQLVTLNITTWPILSRKFSSNAYESLLQGLAQRLFRNHSHVTRCSKLQVIAFGYSDYDEDRQCKIIVKEKNRISYKLPEDVEVSISDILNFPLGVNIPPTSSRRDRNFLDFVAKVTLLLLR